MRVSICLGTTSRNLIEDNRERRMENGILKWMEIFHLVSDGGKEVGEILVQPSFVLVGFSKGI